MDCVAVMLLRALDDLRDVEVGRRSDAFQRNHRFGVLDVVGRGVVGGVDGRGGDSQLGGSAKDTDGDFATVCDEEALDGHGGSLRAGL